MKRHKLQGISTGILISLASILTFSMCAAAGAGGSFPVTGRGPGYTIETRDWPAQTIAGFPEACNRAKAQVYLPQAGPSRARLVLISGWTCGSAWFHHAGAFLAGQCGIEVWAVDRRATLFEDRAGWKADVQAVVNATSNARAALARLQNPQNYLVGKNPALLEKIGYGVVLEDLDVVVREAGRDGKPVWLGGWSDGVEFVMAYALKEFTELKGGRTRGHQRLAGLVILDENPEWGLFSVVAQRQKLGLALGQVEREQYERRWPAVTVFEALGTGGTTASPFAGLFPAARAARASMTGEALLGWLYDGGGYDSGWSWLVSAGSFDKATPLTGWAHGEKTHLSRVTAIHGAPGGVWEWFYPHMIAADYWEIGSKGFSHDGLRISPDKNNRLPVFMSFSGFNNVAGSIPPQGIQWWLGLTGITNTRMLNFPAYRHADILLSASAESNLWRPMAEWIVAGGRETERKTQE